MSRRPAPPFDPRPVERIAPDAGRRSLLKTVALAGIAAATIPPDAAEGRESPEEQTKSRYRLTPHVERFYTLNRL